MGRSVTLARAATHWRDLEAHWHRWRVSGSCESCGCVTAMYIHGTRTDAQGSPLLCRRCKVSREEQTNATQ